MTSTQTTGSSLVKRGLAEMLKGGVIMDVVNAEQAKIAFSDATRFGAYSAAGFLALGFLSTLSLAGKRREESAK